MLQRKEELVVTDSPYTGTKELVGKFWPIQADDHALDPADGLPFGKGTRDIREIGE
jgi:hypothetical protein